MKYNVNITVTLSIKTEITFIPGLLDKCFGKYYNNTLCNGATWMTLFWYLLHVSFDQFLNAFLRRMRYKEYVRIRLIKSLWYLGFYTCAVAYCWATLLRNDLEFLNLKTPHDRSYPSGHLILGFIVLVTFYLHSAIWERLKYCNRLAGTSYIILFFLHCFLYFLRFAEGTFRLTILICITQIALELARCVTTLTLIDQLKKEIFVGTFYTISMIAFVVNYLIAIPVLFGYPLVKEFVPQNLMSLSFLVTWIVVEIYGSVASKAIFHFLNHIDEEEQTTLCDRSYFECSLFPPRTDATFNLLTFKKEMKEREEKCLSLRKPKNRNMVVQTLKCMVAIKKKLKEKRQNAAKDSTSLEDDSAKFEETPETRTPDEVNSTHYENENGAIKFKTD